MGVKEQKIKLREEFKAITEKIKSVKGVNYSYIATAISMDKNRFSSIRLDRSSPTIDELKKLKLHFPEVVGENDQHLLPSEKNAQRISELEEQIALNKAELKNLQLLVSELSKKIE